jgi:ribonuclease HI
MPEKPKFYVVWKGRKTGIFSSWEACAVQVQGFRGAQYKAFSSRAAAERALKGKVAAHLGKPASSGDWLFAPRQPAADSYVVDAACSGSPGRLEYRGVDFHTGKQIFHRGPYEKGTNNIGEFLAIVQALEMLEESDGAQPGTPSQIGLRPVYSDSTTAIAWVKAKKCNTSLVPDGKNAPLFKLIRHAETWLAKHARVHPVLKWDTKAWGENPADFNRK